MGSLPDHVHNNLSMDAADEGLTLTSSGHNDAPAFSMLCNNTYMVGSDSSSCNNYYMVSSDLSSPITSLGYAARCDESEGIASAFPYEAFTAEACQLNTPYPALPQHGDENMARHAFICSYVNTLIPTLMRIHSPCFSLAVDQKLSAVKAAADMSLAVSAGSEKVWSQALLKEATNSAICKSLLRRCGKKHARKSPRKSSFSRALCKKGRSICMPAMMPPYTVNYQPSHSSSDFPVNCAVTARQLLRQYRESLRPVRRNGLSSYLKILRGSRCKRKLKMRNQGSSSPDAGRTPSPVISEQQIESLGGLVPGGRNMDVPLLLQEAADYIVSLQMQVQALQSLAQLVSQ